MRGRFVLAGVGFVFSSAAAFAQIPPPVSPATPRPLPPAVSPGQPQFPPQPFAPPPARSPQPAVPPPGQLPPTQPGLPEGVKPLTPSDVPLPQAENKRPIEAGRITAKRDNGTWQVWAGQQMFRDFGSSEANTTDFVRTLRVMGVTEWVTIGSGTRPVVEYGLVNGLPSVVPGFPKGVTSIDHKKLRVEAMKGVWVVRDDENLHFNFGLNRPDADQTVAVIQKYGFNRVGQIGSPTPALSYLFVALGQEASPQLGGLAVAAQAANLTHTGIMVPGVGYMGEMVKFDPRKLDVRRDGAEWVVAHGPDVFARFGHNEWQARDAARAIQDARFTEFCTVGGAGGVTFFLVNGKAPNRVPFAAQGERFDPNTLRVTKTGERYAVTAAGKRIFDVGSPADGEALIKLLKHFGFDQLCQFGDGRGALRFLAKNR